MKKSQFKSCFILIVCVNLNSFTHEKKYLYRDTKEGEINAKDVKLARFSRLPYLMQHDFGTYDITSKINMVTRYATGAADGRGASTDRINGKCIITIWVMKPVQKHGLCKKLMIKYLPMFLLIV